VEKSNGLAALLTFLWVIFSSSSMVGVAVVMRVKFDIFINDYGLIVI